MAIPVLLGLVLLPVVEIGIFIEVGDDIGLWPTLSLIFLTAAIGLWQIRLQGFSTMRSARKQMDQGIAPTREIFDGFCLVIAGGLLILPGFLTDTIGFLLLIPPARDLLRQWMGTRVVQHRQGFSYTAGQEYPRREPQDSSGRGPTINTSFTVVKDEDSKEDETIIEVLTAPKKEDGEKR